MTREPIAISAAAALQQALADSGLTGRFEADPATVDSSKPADALNLQELGSALLAQARSAPSGKATRALVRTRHQRVALIALCAGHGLGEHASPPAATLQTLIGQVRLYAGESAWVVDPGHLISIPPERHGVDALVDSVIVLTVTPAIQ